MRSIKSFFHVGQFSGSRGESLGCGTSTMSLFRPVACFRREVSRPSGVVRSVGLEIGKYLLTMVAMLSGIEHVREQSRAGHMLEVLVF